MKSQLLGKYIFDEVTDPERMRVEAWLDQDPAHREEYDRLRKNCTLATRNYRYGAFDPGNASAVVFRKRIRPTVLPGIHFLRSYPLQIAASVALLLLFGVGLERYYYAPVSFLAEGNSVRELILPDQSRVKLAPGTKLTYPRHFRNNDRSVSLDGKGYFEVKRKEDAPFRITTAQSTLEVLGTVFQIQAQRQRHDVFVKSGKVRYESNRTGEQLILTANQGAVIDYRTGSLSGELPDVNQFSWATRELVFEQTPLDEVIACINAVYGLTLHPAEEHRSLRLTGTFRDLEPEHLLSLIETTLGITFEQ